MALEHDAYCLEADLRVLEVTQHLSPRFQLLTEGPPRELVSTWH